MGLLLPTPAYPADVTLEWNPVSGAAGYKMYYRSADAPAGEYQPGIDVGANTTGTIPDLDGPYYFAVTAYNAFGESAYSAEVFGNLIQMPVIIRISEDYGNGVTRETTINPDGG